MDRLGSVSEAEEQVVDPGLMGRCAWEVEETRRDVEVLRWVGRFRFVTCDELGERFGVSVQAARARTRRLERLGYLGRERAHSTQPWSVFVTGKGLELLGLPRRKGTPRVDVQREHEAAVVWLVTQLELAADGDVRVLTERECRRREAAEGDWTYSVDLGGGGSRRDRKRWADLVVESEHGKRAIEIEFAPKGRPRLRRIVSAFAHSTYDDVVFLARTGPLLRTLEDLAVSERVNPVFGRLPDPRALAWDGLDEQAVAELVRELPAPPPPRPAVPKPTPIAVPPPPALPPPLPPSHRAPIDAPPAPRRRRWSRR